MSSQPSGRLRAFGIPKICTVDFKLRVHIFPDRFNKSESEEYGGWIG